MIPTAEYPNKGKITFTGVIPRIIYNDRISHSEGMKSIAPGPKLTPFFRHRKS